MIIKQIPMMIINDECDNYIRVIIKQEDHDGPGVAHLFHTAPGNKFIYITPS